MKRIHLSLLSLLLMTGCLGEPVPNQEKGSLVEARAGSRPSSYRRMLNAKRCRSRRRRFSGW